MEDWGASVRGTLGISWFLRALFQFSKRAAGEAAKFRRSGVELLGVVDAARVECGEPAAKASKLISGSLAMASAIFSTFMWRTIYLFVLALAALPLALTLLQGSGGNHIAFVHRLYRDAAYILACILGIISLEAGLTISLSKAIGNRPALKPPFADEGLAPGFDLLGRCGYR